MPPRTRRGRQHWRQWSWTTGCRGGLCRWGWCKARNHHISWPSLGARWLSSREGMPQHSTVSVQRCVCIWVHVCTYLVLSLGVCLNLLFVHLDSVWKLIVMFSPILPLSILGSGARDQGRKSSYMLQVRGTSSSNTKAVEVRWLLLLLLLPFYWSVKWFMKTHTKPNLPLSSLHLHTLSLIIENSFFSHTPTLTHTSSLNLSPSLPHSFRLIYAQAVLTPTTASWWWRPRWHMCGAARAPQVMRGRWPRH